MNDIGELTTSNDLTSQYDDNLIVLIYDRKAPLYRKAEWLKYLRSRQERVETTEHSNRRIREIHTIPSKLPGRRRHDAFLQNLKTLDKCCVEAVELCNQPDHTRTLKTVKGRPYSTKFQKISYRLGRIKKLYEELITLESDYDFDLHLQNKLGLTMDELNKKLNNLLDQQPKSPNKTFEYENQESI